jgi:antirestriction protein ArdC
MSVYDKVLGVILEKMRQGVVPWRQQWKNPQPPMNYFTKQSYKGINLLLLGFHEYESPYFVSMKQVGLLDARVRSGEKGHLIVFYKKVEDKTSLDGEQKKYVMVLKYYHVWNLAQTTYPLPEPVTGISIPDCDQVVMAMPHPPRIVHANANPCYIPSKDKVLIPSKDDFTQPDFYYSTLFHELAHSTGHPSRLNRLTLNDTDGFGGANYSQEELVAEIACCFLCNETRILQNTLDSNATYINNWLGMLQNNKMLLFRAATLAQKAADYILGKAENLPAFFSYCT